jgi:predicted DNA-binding protein (UPF0278 family)
MIILEKNKDIKRLCKNNDIRDLIKVETNGLVTSLMGNYMNVTLPERVSNEVSKGISTHVFSEMTKQFPRYLETHVKTQTLVDEYVAQLTGKVQEITRATIERIVNESQYQTITIAHQEAIKRRYNDQLVEQREKFETTLRAQDSRVTKMLEEKADVIQLLQRQVKDLETQQRWNITYIDIFIFGAPLGFAYCLYKKLW